MTKIKVDNKAAFEANLLRRLKTSGGNVERLFAQHFFADLSITDLNQRRWRDIISSLKSSWKFFKEFKGETPHIRTLNGDENHLILEVASNNQPFLLESILMEINRLGLILVDVQQCLMGVVRSHRKMLISDEVAVNESLIRIEIEAQGAPKELKTHILDVIKTINQVVKDFPLMRRQLLLWSDQSDFDMPADETYGLLRWFYANNFTFLGYEEYKGGSKLHILPESRLGLARPGRAAAGLSIRTPEGVLQIEKLPIRSPVHRPVYLDSLTICERKGNRVVRVCRFMGLFTASVYNQSPTEIPLIRQKVRQIFVDSDLVTSSHRGRELSRIIEILPREELFFAGSADLYRLVTQILSLRERRLVRVMARQDNYFANCIVYVPKDAYNTTLRLQMEGLLVKAFAAVSVEFSTYFSESALTRTHFILRIDQQKTVDLEALEREITTLTRSWNDELQQLIMSDDTNSEAARQALEYKQLFTPKYQADFPVDVAYEDLQYIDALTTDSPLGLKFYRPADADGASVHFRIYHLGKPSPLSEVVPVLENLGARCIEEHPYKLRHQGLAVWVRDFVLALDTTPICSIEHLKDMFEDTFYGVWLHGVENDNFNRLVPAAAMGHRQVALIRTYSRYFGQLQSANSQQFISDCMTRYAHITAKLLQLFEYRFDPSTTRTVRKANNLTNNILNLIAEDVVNLSDDRVLHGYVEMILATQRTNYFQLGDDGNVKGYVALKLFPEAISEMPEPKPQHEIFVYSPRVEGVHLRGGKISRGGLRWSDRSEDYRTEVLGLEKAQEVKNSVIVPVGAKGGFLPKELPKNLTTSSGRDAFMAEGIACYRIFIQGLLDLTDNLKNGRVIKPKQVVCYDDDDYYLVVAADKGTATFSDIANEISDANEFWLGDAFASGGSVGYDHKVMGITAKGAWKSVQQHFRDLGTDVQRTDFSTIGIGDMSGDVFGNGMLLSKHICLVAAFNHLHIFIDPAPNSASSYKERSRLFKLDRSGWSDYNTKLISKGGGVFERSAKSIRISAEMKKRFDITESQLTPNQLITAILKSQVDLLWNGGIGTYVKSSVETHLDVADKSNDAIRINGHELGARVVGEGGNLGMTQLARVEFCLTGGTCFTDFIDNAGGVNCSDVEVNIKILLNQLLMSKQLAAASRNGLLAKMTEEVADIVLDNNYRQAQAINLMSYQSQKRDHEYASLLKHLEEQGKINRALEFLPSEEELSERRLKGLTFTAPEISVLTSYVKGDLKEALIDSNLADESYARAEMLAAFPASLVKKYPEALQSHQLVRELVATQVANGMVNFMGMNFVSRLQASTGESVPKIAKSFLVARDLLALPTHWQALCDLDYKIDHRVQKQMMMELIRLTRRVTRWLLRNRRRSSQLEQEIDAFSLARQGVVSQLEKLLNGDAKDDWLQRRAEYQSAGAPRSLAGLVAASHHLYGVMGIAEAAQRTGQGIERIAEVYFELGDVLNLNWFSRQIHDYQANNRWQALARESLQDDLHWQQVALTQSIVDGASRSKSSTKLIADWAEQNQAQVSRWVDLQSEMRSAQSMDPAIFTVGNRELLDLAQSSRLAGVKK